MKKIYLLLLCFTLSMGIVAAQTATKTKESAKETKKEVVEKGKKINTDSIVREAKDATLSKTDSATMAQDSLRHQTELIEKPTSDSPLLTRLNYWIAFVVIIIMFLLGFITKLANIADKIKIPFIGHLLQRLFSSASPFVNTVMGLCATGLATIQILLEFTQVIPADLITILNNVSLALLSISGFCLFLTKKPQLQGIKPTDVTPPPAAN
jgi:hypothetical protein